MEINYHNRRFKALSQSQNGEVDDRVIFHYRQVEQILSCQYQGGNIKYGQLIGTVAEDGSIDMRYHQINQKGELMTGICHSTPIVDDKGILTLHEKWQWTCGDKSHGKSILIEI